MEDNTVWPLTFLNTKSIGFIEVAVSKQTAEAWKVVWERYRETGEHSETVNWEN